MNAVRDAAIHAVARNRFELYDWHSDHWDFDLLTDADAPVTSTYFADAEEMMLALEDAGFRVVEA